MNYCSQCGKQLASDAKFCKSCGRATDDTVESKTDTAVQPNYPVVRKTKSGSIVTLIICLPAAALCF